MHIFGNTSIINYSSEGCAASGSIINMPKDMQFLIFIIIIIGFSILTPIKSIKENKILLTKNGCEHCEKTKKYLSDNNIKINNNNYKKRCLF